MGNNNKRDSFGRVIIPTPKDSVKPSLIWIVLTVFCPPLCALLIYFRIKNTWKIKKLRDYRSYMAIIGTEAHFNLNILAQKLGKPLSLVRDDLKAMIAKGYLGDGAYVDMSRNELITKIDAPQYNTVDWTYGKPQPKPAQTPAYDVKPEVKPEPVKPKKDEDEYEQILRQIHEANVAIEDANVSAKIDQIGALTASIFAFVREHPEQKDEVRKFMSYYLPTTLKLLKSYAMMEEQRVQSKSIRDARKRIEDILVTLIEAFTTQQDKLYRDETLDVETDISVLEQMMAADGLVTPKGMTMPM